MTNRILFVLALVGVYVALRLTIAHITDADLPCGPFAGCDEVGHHPTASGFGIPALKAIPTAGFGLAMFCAVAVLSLVRVFGRSNHTNRLAADAQWLLSAGGVLVSAYLTYLEAYVIKAWCAWCVASALLTLALLLVTTLEHLMPAVPAQGEVS